MSISHLCCCCPPSLYVPTTTRSYQPYVQGPDTAYYLNVSDSKPNKKPALGKQAVAQATSDILGAKLLGGDYSHLSWELVASALP
eukprot:COSAG01_NODE_3382_length_6164_cov_204.291838_5_plen_85_part_00